MLQIIICFCEDAVQYKALQHSDYDTIWYDVFQRAVKNWRVGSFVYQIEWNEKINKKWTESKLMSMMGLVQSNGPWRQYGVTESVIVGTTSRKGRIWAWSERMREYYGSLLAVYDWFRALMACSSLFWRLWATGHHCGVSLSLWHMASVCARPKDISAAIEHHFCLADTKLYCLITGIHLCKQLAQWLYISAHCWELKLRSFVCNSKGP